MAFEYISLQKEFWYHSDPIKEANRLLALHSVVSDSLGDEAKAILFDAQRISEHASASQEEAAYVDTMLVLARIHHALGDQKKTFEHARLTLSFNPEHHETLNFLSEITDENGPAPVLRSAAFKLLAQYRNTGEPRLIDKALLLTDLALEYDTGIETERTYRTKAAIYRDSDQKALAIENLTIALSINPNHEESLKLLARMEEGGEIPRQSEDRSKCFYTPSPEGPVRDFMRNFHETHNDDFIGPHYV